MPTVALVTDRSCDGQPEERRRSEERLVDALTARGVTVERSRWHEVDGVVTDVDLVVLREAVLDPDRREALLAWARTTAEDVPVHNPVEVLRWGSHRSFLLELEERGAPLAATAWLARGDRTDLDALLRSRGWARARIVPAVRSGDEDATIVGHGACHVAAGQGALDRLLTLDDAMVQEVGSPDRAGPVTSCLVVDGRASHLVPDGEMLGEEPAALAEWVVDATGVELLAARVDLTRDPVGTWQVTDLDVVAPDLALTASPGAADRVVDAILRRLG